MDKIVPPLVFSTVSPGGDNGTLPCNTSIPGGDLVNTSCPCDTCPDPHALYPFSESLSTLAGTL